MSDQEIANQMKRIMAKNIQRLLDRKGIDQSQMATELRFPESTVSNWMTATTYPRLDKIQAMADYFGINRLELIEDKAEAQIGTPFVDLPNNILPISTRKLPLLGEIAAGVPIFADEDFECYVEAGAGVNADFCLKVKGDSMINARINDGDIVFVQKQSIVENGQIAAVLVDDEATLKRFYQTENQIMLVAENQAYMPMVFRNEEIDNVRILGRAVAFQSDIK